MPDLQECDLVEQDIEHDYHVWEEPSWTGHVVKHSCPGFPAGRGATPLAEGLIPIYLGEAGDPGRTLVGKATVAADGEAEVLLDQKHPEVERVEHLLEEAGVLPISYEDGHKVVVVQEQSEADRWDENVDIAFAAAATAMKRDNPYRKES